MCANELIFFIHLANHQHPPPQPQQTQQIQTQSQQGQNQGQVNSFNTIQLRDSSKEIIRKKFQSYTYSLEQHQSLAAQHIQQFKIEYQNQLDNSMDEKIGLNQACYTFIDHVYFIC